MRKYLAYFLIIIGWSFHANSAEAGRTTLNVDGFGRFSIDDVEVDFDRVHSNLRRFEEHASSAVGASGFKNNIAVGAITVFFGEEDDAASRSTSTSSGAIKAAKTFYLETSSQTTERKLLVFESTPCEGEEDIKWGISGLGCIDGHSMMACQPYNIKSLCFTKMHSFFQQMKKDNESDDEGEYLTSPLSSSTSTSSSSTSSSSSAPQLSPREKVHPLFKMITPLASLTGTAGTLRSLRDNLRKDWAPLRHLADAYKKLFDEESSQESLIPGLETLEGVIDTEEAANARDYVFRIGESVNKIEKSLDSLDTLIESAPSQLKEFKELVKRVKKDATKIYNECWHSEQRLFHFLFSQLADEEDFSSSSEQSYSSSEEPQTPIPNLEETTFNWDAVASVGDELQPKVIFLHIHSRLSFCDMCLYTLEEFVPRLMRKVTSFPPGWQLGGILGSYRTPYNQDMLNRIPPGSTPWIGKSPFSIAELEDHRSESGIPSLYITTWK